MWFVYLIQTKKGIYTGVTTNLLRRYYQHSGKVSGGAKFFRGNPPQKLLYFEIYSSRSTAQKRESEIKKFNRSQKLELV